MPLKAHQDTLKLLVERRHLYAESVLRAEEQRAHYDQILVGLRNQHAAVVSLMEAIESENTIPAPTLPTSDDAPAAPDKDAPPVEEQPPKDAGTAQEEVTLHRRQPGPAARAKVRRKRATRAEMEARSIAAVDKATAPKRRRPLKAMAAKAAAKGAPKKRGRPRKEPVSTTFPEGAMAPPGATAGNRELTL